MSEQIENRMLASTIRRMWLATRHVECPKCKSVQIELTAYIQTVPAEWKCRHCKHKFEFEPEKNGE